MNEEELKQMGKEELLGIIKAQRFEIERLKRREQECIDHYLVQCKYASKMEDKYITANYVINELGKYLEEEKDRLAVETSTIYEDSLGKTRLVNEDIFNEIIIIQDKIKALKGDSS